MRVRNFIVSIFFIIIFSASARNPYYQFKNITINDGLPSNLINDIGSDSSGLIWLSSENYLCSYDGYLVKRYPCSYQKTGKHILGKPRRLLIMGHILWTNSDSCINKMDLITQKVTYYNIEKYKSTIEKRSHFLNIWKDNTNRIWYLRSGDIKGYLDEKNDVMVAVLPDESNPYSIPKRGIMQAVADSTGYWGAFWANGITKYVTAEDKFYTYPVKFNPKNENSLIFSLVYDQKNSLWMGLYDGVENKYPSLVKMEMNTKKMTPFIYNRNNKFSINSNRISSLCIDKFERIWVGSPDQGLAMYEPVENRFYSFKHNLDDEESMSESRINQQSIFCDNSNKLWALTLNNGLCYTDLKNKDVFLYKLSNNEDINDAKMLAFFQDKNHNTWLGTKYGIFKYSSSLNEFEKINTQALLNNKIYTSMNISQYDDENILIDIEKVFFKCNMVSNKISKLPHNIFGKENVYKTYIDKNGNFWAFVKGKIFIYRQYNFFEKKIAEIEIDLQTIPDELYLTHVQQYKDKVYAGSGKNIIEITLKDYSFKKLLLTSDTTNTLGIKERRVITDFYCANDTIHIFTSNNIFIHCFSSKVTQIVSLEKIIEGSTVPVVLRYAPGKICFSSYTGIHLYDYFHDVYSNPSLYSYKKIDPDFFIRGYDNQIFVGVGNGFLSFKPSLLEIDHSKKTNVVISELYLFNKFIELDDPSCPIKQNITYAKEAIFNYKQSVFSFELSLLGYGDKEKYNYAYYMQGFESGYNYIGNRKVATYTNLPPGNYTFRYKAADENLIWSDEKSLKVIILPPFWATWWFKLLVVGIILGAIYLYIKVRLNTIHRQKEKLENEVKLRTAEIMNQNEEILAQKEEIELQQQKISELYREVTDSIQTAKRIQESILPPDELIKQFLPNSFVLYMPKDIVSGDFYWFHVDVDRIYIAAVDCTGHGVAGAFMSLIGYNLLNRIMSERKKLSCKDILDRLNNYVIQVLHQDSENAITKDGMEVAMCCIDSKKNIVQFAGANLPMYIMRNNNLEIIKAEGNWVGIQPKNKVAHFHNHEIAILPNDIFYIFSDGFAGQFGGESGDEKFKYNRFREALSGLHNLTFEEQKVQLYKKFVEWKKNTEQTDDIMVIGFSV